MLIADCYGIGSKRVSVDEGESILAVASKELARLLASRGVPVQRVKVQWPASMARVGGDQSWDEAAREGVRNLDEILARSPGEPVVLLGYSGGCKVVHDWLDQRPDARHRVAAVGLMSDPFRPRGRWQATLPDPGGWGICGEKLGPIPGRTFWTSSGPDVISSCPADSPLRTFADVSDKIPGSLLDDLRGHLVKDDWQLATYMKMWRKDPLGYLRDLPRRMHVARTGVEGYLASAHTLAYTRGNPSLALQLAGSINWALKNGDFA